MDKNSSNQNSKDSINRKILKQRKRIIKEIKDAEKNGLFEIIFYEEMFDENKKFLKDRGYTLLGHGGPPNSFYTIINWR